MRNDLMGTVRRYSSTEFVICLKLKILGMLQMRQPVIQHLRHHTNIIGTIMLY